MKSVIDLVVGVLVDVTVSFVAWVAIGAATFWTIAVVLSLLAWGAI